MPLPDRYENEPAMEVEPELWKLYNGAKTAEAAWGVIARGYLAKIQERLGAAHAALVAGVKVATYRPTEGYAVAALQKAYPDLTQHYMVRKTQMILDIDRFSVEHPDIAEKYRIRSFRKTET